MTDTKSKRSFLKLLFGNKDFDDINLGNITYTTTVATKIYKWQDLNIKGCL
jgi:hypothetical protein